MVLVVGKIEEAWIKRCGSCSVLSPIYYSSTRLTGTNKEIESALWAILWVSSVGFGFWSSSWLLSLLGFSLGWSDKFSSCTLGGCCVFGWVVCGLCCGYSTCNSEVSERNSFGSLIWKLASAGVVWVSIVDIVAYGRLSGVSECSTRNLLSKKIMSKYGVWSFKGLTYFERLKSSFMMKGSKSISSKVCGYISVCRLILLYPFELRVESKNFQGNLAKTLICGRVSSLSVRFWKKLYWNCVTCKKEYVETHVRFGALEFWDKEDEKVIKCWSNYCNEGKEELNE